MYGENDELMFDVDSAPKVSFEPLPAGYYDCEITGAEIKANSKGTGRYVKVEFTIAVGLHFGRKHWEMFNIEHENEKAQQIGRGQFGELCRAAGLLGIVAKASSLLNKTCRLKLKIEEAKGDFDAKNRATKYEAIPSAEALAEKEKELASDKASWME